MEEGEFCNWIVTTVTASGERGTGSAVVCCGRLRGLVEEYGLCNYLLGADVRTGEREWTLCHVAVDGYED